MEFKPRGERISFEEVNSLFILDLKWCSKCKTVKCLTEFSKSKGKTHDLDSSCKECRRISSEQRRIDYPEKTKEIRRNSRNKHAEKSRKNKKIWAENNKDHIREYKRDKYENDPNYKLTCTCRQMVKRMFKSTGIKKCYKTQEILGYNVSELKQHIEKQFKDGMTWDNYGDWHIDHIIPISSAKNLEEGIKLSKLENLQPLWAIENITKGNKLGEDNLNLTE